MKKSKMTELLSRYKYPMLVLLVGCALLLIPTGSGAKVNTAAESDESRLAQMLEQSEGVGKVGVLLSENGAVIVCDGADNAQVRLNITEAVRAYTGLGYDRIQVLRTSKNMGGQNE